IGGRLDLDLELARHEPLVVPDIGTEFLAQSCGKSVPTVRQRDGGARLLRLRHASQPARHGGSEQRRALPKLLEIDEIPFPAPAASVSHSDRSASKPALSEMISLRSISGPPGPGVRATVGLEGEGSFARDGRPSLVMAGPVSRADERP